jgi:hypothetical protein
MPFRGTWERRHSCLLILRQSRAGTDVRAPREKIFHASLQADNQRVSAIPQPGRLGIFHANLQSRRPTRLCGIPQPARWGIFHSCLQKRTADPPAESPNRQVGDLSLLPTETDGRPSCGIPQPAGWGSFHASLQSGQFRRFRNPPTGRLGIFHSCVPGNRAMRLLKVKEAGSRLSVCRQE